MPDPRVSCNTLQQTPGARQSLSTLASGPFHRSLSLNPLHLIRRSAIASFYAHLLVTKHRAYWPTASRPAFWLPLKASRVRVSHRSHQHPRRDPPVQPPASSAASHLAVPPRMLSYLCCRIPRNSLAGAQGLIIMYNGLTHRFPLPPLRIHSSTHISRTIWSHDQEMRSSKSTVRGRTSQAWTLMQALQRHAHTYTKDSPATQPPWIRLYYRCHER